MTDVETRFRTCHLCEAICGLEIDVDGGKIVAIRGDAKDPLSRGHLCPKAVALQDIHEDPDRLRRPVRRTPSGWDEIGWDEAFSLAGERIRSVQREYGRDAVGMFTGNPTVHNLGALFFAPPLSRALRSKNRFSATSVDQLPHHFAGWAMFGHQLLIPIPDIDHTDFFLMFGGNPLASNGSLMTVPDVRKRLEAVRARGRVVLVDPRRTETARYVDTHVFIRPGTDALMLAAMVRTLFEEDLVQLGRLAAMVDGVDAVRDVVAPFAPELVAPVCGVGADVIRGLARELAAAPSGAVHGRMGLSTQAFGGLCQWLVQVVNVLTGNLDRVGGVLFTKPAVEVLTRLSPGRFARWRSRVRGLPEFGGELPAVVMAEEMSTPGEGQIRAFITLGGNPVLSTPNGVALDQALEGLDFMVCIDPYINETTRHADLILPPVSPLERAHYDLIFNTLAVRNYARYSPPLFEKSVDGRHDWEILADLHLEVMDPRDLKGRLTVKSMRRLGATGLLDLGLRTGPYGKGLKPWGPGLTRARLEAQPHGVDLGPLEPQLPQVLWTEDKRVKLGPQLFLDDMERLIESLEAGGGTGPVLIGRRHVRSCNSWMHNYERLVRGKNRCTLLVHPDDAARFGVEDGQDARVSSRVGAVVVPVQVSDEMMPGVVSLPHGWGHGRKGVRLGVAAAHAGVSMNDLTDPAEVDLLTGNAVLNGVPVEVAPA
jgi:anaerobic selenocysteine-containing dehydrogenase